MGSKPQHCFSLKFWGWATLTFGFKCMCCVRRECSGGEGFKLAGKCLVGMDKPSSPLQQHLKPAKEAVLPDKACQQEREQLPELPVQ